MNAFPSRGFSLLIAASLVAALTTIVSSLMGLGLGSAHLANQRKSQVVAQELAEMGLARVLADLRQQTGSAFDPNLDVLLLGDGAGGGPTNVPPAAAFTVNGVTIGGWGNDTETIDGQVFRRVSVTGLGAYYVRIDDNQDDSLVGLAETTRAPGEGTGDVAAADRDQGVVILARGVAGPGAVSWTSGDAAGWHSLRATVRGTGPKSVMSGGNFTPANNASVCGQGAVFCSAAAAAAVNCLCGAIRVDNAGVQAALAARPQCDATAGCNRCDTVSFTIQPCAPVPVPPAPTAAEVDPRASDFGNFQAVAGTCFFRMDRPVAGSFPAGSTTVHIWDNAANAACANSTTLVTPDFDPTSGSNFPADCWAPVWVSDSAWPGVGGPTGATDNNAGKWAPGFTDGRIHVLDTRATGLASTIPLWSGTCSCVNCVAGSAGAWVPAANTLVLDNSINPRGVYLSTLAGTLNVVLGAAAVNAAVLTTAANLTLQGANMTLTHPLAGGAPPPAGPLEVLVAGGSGSCTLADTAQRLEHGMRCGGSATLSNPNDILAGNVTVVGNFNANVDGVQMFLVNPPRPATLWVGGNAVFKNSSVLYANIRVAGNLQLGNSDTVNGTVWSGGNLDPGNDLKVNPPSTVDSLLGSTTTLSAVQSLPY